MGNKNIFLKVKEYISKLLDSKLLIVLVLLLVFFMMLYMYIRPIESNTKDKEDPSKEIVAYIDGKKITFDEIEKRAEDTFYIDKKNIIENLGSDVYKRELAKYVIYEEVLYKKAKEEDINVTKQEIEDTYYKMQKFIKEGLNLNEDEFKSKYANDSKKIMIKMRKSIKAYKYLDEKTKVDDSEAKKYYDANKDKYKVGVYRDIFISTVDCSGKTLGKDEVKDAENRAYDIYKKLEEGYKFEDLENEYSEDIKGTIPGGVGDLEMDFDDESIKSKISNLDEGEYIEKPIKSSYGYHVVKRIGTEVEPFEKVKEEIKNTLSYKKQIKLIEELLAEYDVKFTEKYK